MAVAEPSNPVAADRAVVSPRWLGLLTAVAVLCVCTATVADPDLWGHTLYGLRTLEAGRLVEPADPFSYTAPGAAWVNHEWLTETIYGWLWSRTGDAGLWMWRNVLAVVTLGVAASSIARARAGWGAALLLVVFAAQTLEPFFMFIRPQLATFACWAVWLAIVRRHWDEPTTRAIWWLPAIAAVWVNLHGGFLAGLAVHVVVIAAHAWRAWRAPEYRRAFGEIAAVGVFAGLATLLNPYGWRLHWMLWTHLVPEQAVREWAPLWTAGGSIVYYLPFVPLLLALIGSRRWQAIELAVLAAASYAAIAHLRHVALLSIATLVLLPGPLDDALRRLFPRLTENWKRRRSAWAERAVVGAVCSGLVFSQLVWLDGWSRHHLRPWEIGVESWRQTPGVPLRALTVVQRERLDGNLITDYAWAQYVIWHRHPENLVAFDGRYRTIYPADVERDFLAWIKADDSDPQVDRLLDAYPSQIVLMPREAPACRRLARRSDWIELYADDQARLFVRRLPRFAEVIARAEAGGLSEPIVARWNRFPAGPLPTDGMTLSAK